MERTDKGDGMGKIVSFDIKEIATCANCGKWISDGAIECPSCDAKNPKIKWIQFVKPITEYD